MKLRCGDRCPYYLRGEPACVERRCESDVHEVPPYTGGAP